MLTDYNMLYGCALQSCIVGTGGKNLGSIQIENVVYDCKEILIKNKVLINNKQNSKLEPGQLTLRRVCRIFRYHISNYIRDTKNYSYLYKKYCHDDLAKPHLIFPGAEHIVILKEDAQYLRNCYLMLDSKLETSFVTRIDRVYQARGIKLGLFV